MTIRIIIAGVALLTQLASAGATHAGFEASRHEASREDTRQHCISDGRILVDRLDYTFCEDKLTGIGPIR